MTHTTQSSRDSSEDHLYEQWSQAQSSKQKEELEPKLIKALHKHAIAISYQILGVHRADIANFAAQRALEKIDSFRGESKFSTWYQALVMNLCRREGAKISAARKNEVSLEELGTELPTSPEAMDARIHVQQLLKTLEPQERQMIELKLEGYTSEEIAEKLGMASADAVNTFWARTKEKLREAV